MIRDEYGQGFRFTLCVILVFWLIWILSFLLNRIWIGCGFYNLVLNFSTTFGSVLGLYVTVFKSLVSEFHRDCRPTLCLFKCWPLTTTSDTTSLLSYVSCQQSYGIGLLWLSLIQPVPLLDSSLLNVIYTPSVPD